MGMRKREKEGMTSMCLVKTVPHTTMNVMYATGDSAMWQLIFIAFYTMDCYLRMRRNMLPELTLQFGITDINIESQNKSIAHFNISTRSTE